MKIAKNILALFLVLLMIICCMPAALAEGGTAGSITWDYNSSTKTLTFSGSGAIPTYESSDSRPWRSCSSECQSVIIQDGITAVGDYACYNFTALQTATISDSVESIGKCAFQNDSKLESVTIGSKVVIVGGSAFSQCYKLTTVVGGSGIKTIGNNAFYSCQRLSSFTFSEKLESIGNYAFENCYKLPAVNLPNSLKTIGKRAFFKTELIETVRIPDGVTSIGEQTFFGCKKLQTISIPSSVKTIGDYAFVNCNDLATINYGGSESEWNSITMGSCVFGWYDTSYTERTSGEMPKINYSAAQVGGNIGNLSWLFDGLTKTLTISGSGDMQDFSSLAPWREICRKNGCENIIIENGVTSVGENAFMYLEGVTNISIANNVTKIGDMAFYACTALTSVTIPDGVTSIGEQTFFGCKKLQTVSIPASVTSIGDYAFENCNALQTINYGGSKQQWNNINFGDYVFGWYTGGHDYDRTPEQMPLINYMYGVPRVKSVSAGDISLNYKSSAYINASVESEAGASYTVT